LAHRPRLQEALMNNERAEALLSEARAQYWPHIMLQYRQRRMMGRNTHDGVVGFSVPLWFWKQNAMVQEAKAEKAMVAAEADFMRNMTQFDVKKFLIKVQTAARLVELYRSSVLPQSEQALKVAEGAYRSDKGGFLDLLDASRSLLEFRLEHYQHLADVQMFVADLERVVGRDIQEVQK
jgi:outer membrane protein, heavy metal efflux system